MPARILVVEDDVSLGENLCEILDLFGYVPVAVRSAEEALVELATSPIDLILTDFRLPSMNGSDLLARLRSLGHAIPAVLMSDWRADDAEEILRSDVECVAKPLDIAGLLSSISRLLSGSTTCAPPPRFTSW